MAGAGGARPASRSVSGLAAIWPELEAVVSPENFGRKPVFLAHEDGGTTAEVVAAAGGGAGGQGPGRLRGFEGSELDIVMELLEEVH